MKKCIDLRLCLLTLLPFLSHVAWGQASLTLDKVIHLAQDSAITAFQSRQGAPLRHGHHTHHDSPPAGDHRPVRPDLRH